MTDKHPLDQHTTFHTKRPPVVIAIAGLDPSGGAGIQADIQTLSSLNCHCAPIITTLTTQDSGQLYASQPVDHELIAQQISAITNELPIGAIKIGALGNEKNAIAVARVIESLKKDHSQLPVILDPVIGASGGGLMSNAALQRVLVSRLIPLCTLTTPNTPELNALLSENHESAVNRVQETIHALALSGSAILVTGGHNSAKENGYIINQLFTEESDRIKTREWAIETIKGEFRGTGCTLSSAIAGFMALDYSLEAAIEHAQNFVSYSLLHGYSLESGKQIPQRVARYRQAADSYGQ